MAVIVWNGSAGDGDFTNASNWTGGAPGASDDVWFNTGNVSVTTGLTPSLVTYASFNVTDDYTGTIGTESSFLTINSTLVNIGGGNGAGSQRINLNLGTVTSTVKITSSNGTGADTNRPPIRIVCNTTNTDFFISGDTSNVGIIDEPDDSGSVGDINISGGTVKIGSGITDYDALNISGSGTVVEVNKPDTAATITVDDGTVTINGTQAIAAVVQRGGTVNCNTTGTITAYTLRGGTLDLQQSDQARTITTLTQSPLGTTVRHNRGVVTLTNDIQFDTNYKLYTVSMSES